jgi:phage replication-related protein YjqB (UPF0714/DUF867 family)
METTPLDKYPNFAALQAAERRGIDYRTVVRRRHSLVAVIAPHGGGIEEGTSELATAIAGEELCLYCFEGLKQHGNGNLHITSVHFDDPACLQMVGASSVVVAIHGLDDLDDLTHVGGRDARLASVLAKALREAGFAAQADNSSEHAGLRSDNICNRGLTGGGCQLELSRGRRKTFFEGLGRAGRRRTLPPFGRFVDTVRIALLNWPK